MSRPRKNNPTSADMILPVKLGKRGQQSSERFDALVALARQYGCMFGDTPNISAFIRAIADGELTVIPTPPKKV